MNFQWDWKIVFFSYYLCIWKTNILPYIDDFLPILLTEVSEVNKREYQKRAGSQNEILRELITKSKVKHKENETVSYRKGIEQVTQKIVLENKTLQWFLHL